MTTTIQERKEEPMTFEQIREMFQETGRQLKETGRQFKELAQMRKKTDQQIENVSWQLAGIVEVDDSYFEARKAGGLKKFMS
jgi:hypothetical protein